ncbi:hypothetical protein BDV96DRAFT_640991 [Lophiotrema nucula]|uniref:C2H2-type domain-containing protein n=1 Tax=Lophiotrema nucula TaxID=690887 RepID=A0A6A5ZRX1_9PLEO|nr:hypothetical protein BDV96DRAFT_640991 [Lophiotrema nucula]
MSTSISPTPSTPPLPPFSSPLASPSTTQPQTPVQKALNNASPLTKIPADIATHRSLLFALDTPVQLTAAVWHNFWPYVDNVWCIHQKPQPSPVTGVAKVYGGCRLARKTNFPLPEVTGKSRPRQRREGGTCKAKVRVTVYADGRRVVERMGDGHSHDLDHIDSVKRNSGVRNLVLDDFFKSWEAGGILAFLRDTSKATADGDGGDILKDAGGLYLSRQEVQNILNGALKKAYPGQDVSEVKRQMDKYKNYTTCNFKGCDAQAFPDIKALMDHRKAVHGLRSHDHSDKMYACPDKSCWRRKKSKGFATLLGLEEHLREKHGKGSETDVLRLGVREMDNGHLDAGPVGHLGLNMGFDMMNPLLPNFPGDPITPDSDDQDQGLQLHDAEHELDEEGGVERQEAARALTHMERESMKIRIKRLVIERSKLDAEIKRLNTICYGSGSGEVRQDLDDG